MAKGTPKTFSELNSLFPDNKSGNISPADARDLIATAVNHPDYVPVWPFGSDGTRSERATAVQGAIDHASSEGKAGVLVQDSFTDYDASAVTFDSSVRMIREGGDPSVYDVVAYGAAGDGPTGTDDVAAINACASAADSAGRTYFFHPPGTYTVSVAPTIPAGVVPVGDDASYDGDTTPITDVGTASRTDGDDRPWLQHDPSVLDADAAKFLFTVADRDHNVGTRENLLYRWGYNPRARDAAGVADSATDGFSFADVLETHFEPNTAGDGNFERYWSFSDGANEYRPFSVVAPKETVDSTRFKDENALSVVGWTQTFRPTTGDGRLLRLAFDGNDPWQLLVLDGVIDITRQDASLADNSGLDAELRLTGKYDSDAGASTTASPLRFTIQNRVAHNGGSGSHKLAFVNDAGATLMVVDGENKRVGINRTNPSPGMDLDVGGKQQWVLGTEALSIQDAGSTGATEQDWVEVQVGGVTGYLRVHAAK